MAKRLTKNKSMITKKKKKMVVVVVMMMMMMMMTAKIRSQENRPRNSTETTVEFVHLLGRVLANKLM